jgi:hypothetical protein|tara:strand:+ start:626 stop:907 length:282 start_codon:yes stop_codon:yes gene_type:complete
MENPTNWPETITLEGYPFHCELIEERASEDCGCPEELWIMGSLEVTLHLEEDGQGHVIADAGDWEGDLFTECSGIEDLRTHAADWINTFPLEE